jgi:dTDP-D-glucose 4,6-dehydratase
MILVTGGLGFIGSRTVRSLLDANEHIVATKFRTARIPSFLEAEISKRVIVEILDTSSPHGVIEIARKYPITSILHLVVTPSGALSAAEDFRVNMQGLINVLEAGRIALNYHPNVPTKFAECFQRFLERNLHSLHDFRGFWFWPIQIWIKSAEERRTPSRASRM